MPCLTHSALLPTDSLTLGCPVVLRCFTASPAHRGRVITLYANQYAAYGAMSESLRNILAGLYWHLPRIPYSEIPAGKGLIQPTVRPHPETGRKLLFCPPSDCQIRGVTRYESARILKLVHEYQVRDEFVYRHAWGEPDVVVRENCTLLHNRADVVDFATQGLRATHRSATSGSFGAVEREAAGG